jgi:predicted negative regulator of RcsB-dependent stress response
MLRRVMIYGIVAAAVYFGYLWYEKHTFDIRDRAAASSKERKTEATPDKKEKDDPLAKTVRRRQSDEQLVSDSTGKTTDAENR